MAEDVQKRADTCVPLSPPSEHESDANGARRDRTGRANKDDWHRRREHCDAKVVASEKASGVSPDSGELYRGPAAVVSAERYPRSYLPTTVFSSRGLVDGDVCRVDHPTDCCGGMVVEVDGGFRPASKADYRASMVGNRGGPAFCCTRDLALVYSQARHLTWPRLSDVCADRSPRSRVSGKLGRQNGIRTVMLS